MNVRNLLLFLFVFVNSQFTVSTFKLSDVKQSPLKQDEDPGEPLILTPYLEKGEIQEARNLSKVPEEYFLAVESYTGFFTVNKTHDSNIFFWFIPATNVDYREAPIVLWLQGGPGASSMFGLFNEHGPFEVVNGTLVLREGTAWSHNHSMIYIDNPVGAGYSFTNGRLLINEEEVGEDLYTALIQFFQLFPELQKNEFFVTGESYGGKYVPAISYTIHKKNPDAKLKINLKGLAIGNGLCDPINQMNYGDILYQVGLIDDNVRQLYKQVEDKVADLIEKEQYSEAYNEYAKLGLSDQSLFVNVTGYSTYYTFIDPVLDIHEESLDFIQSNTIRKAIHVGNTTFYTQNADVFNDLSEDIIKSVAPWISELLSHYRVMFYNGQLDIIVGYALTDNFLRKLNFSSAAEFKTVERKQWMVNDEIAGYVKVAGNLTQVMVRNAGHMVPRDQPIFALEMIRKFIANIPL